MNTFGLTSISKKGVFLTPISFNAVVQYWGRRYKSNDLVKCEFIKEGKIAVLRLNDPDRLNALTESMGDRLEQRVKELRGARGLRAAVLTGEGDGEMCTSSNLYSSAGKGEPLVRY